MGGEQDESISSTDDNNDSNNSGNDKGVDGKWDLGSMGSGKIRIREAINVARGGPSVILVNDRDAGGSQGKLKRVGVLTIGRPEYQLPEMLIVIKVMVILLGATKGYLRPTHNKQAHSSRSSVVLMP